jgi:hypothetical protein
MIRKGLSKGGVRDEEGMHNQDRAVSLAGACGTYEKEEIRRTNWMLEEDTVAAGEEDVFRLSLARLGLWLAGLI